LIAAAANLGIKAHAHMLRHACGYKLANDGIDTRVLQAYLGHRNIQNTTRYTALAPDRFKGFWRTSCLGTARSGFPWDPQPLSRPGIHRAEWAKPRHPYQQRPVTTVQPQTRRRSPQYDVELMRRNRFSASSLSRLEYVGDEHHEQVQDRKHRA
jgi:hypothetical protein